MIDKNKMNFIYRQNASNSSNSSLQQRLTDELQDTDEHDFPHVLHSRPRRVHVATRETVRMWQKG